MPAAAGGVHFRLIEIGMEFHLVDGKRRVGGRDHLAQQGGREVGNTDVAGEPPRLHPVQRTDGVGDRDIRIGPVDEQQVEMVEAETLQARLRRSFELLRFELGPPDFRGHEDLVARKVRGAQAGTHGLLIVIAGRGVDMPVADLERMRHQVGTALALQRPRPHSRCGNPCTIGLDDLHIHIQRFIRVAHLLAHFRERLQQQSMTLDQKQQQDRAPAVSRIEAIDLARGAALVAMAIYHFTWDLEFFGYADPGLTAHGGWKLFARSIASSFLFLAGVSLVLAHGKGIRWNGFLRRLAMVAGAALAISIVTYIAVPGGFIFFGILHEIALASLIGLAFLRLPAVLTLAVAVAVIAAPHFLRSAFFDHPFWWWLGLSSVDPRSNDYVPLFPWFGAVLAGIGAAKLAQAAGLFGRLGALHPGSWSRPLQLAGRHSLAVYLIHQPVLIACVWAFSHVFPPATQTREVAFLKSCERQCAETRDAEFCTRYCVCMLDTLERDGLVEQVFSGDESNALQSQVERLAAVCTADTDRVISEGGIE